MIIDNNVNEIQDHLKTVIVHTTDPKDIEILVNSYKNIGTPVIIDNNIPVNGEFHYKNGINDGIRLVETILAKDLNDFETIRNGLNDDTLYSEDSIHRKVNQALIDYIERLVERLNNRISHE